MVKRYNPEHGEAVVELWDGRHHGQDGIWAELMIYALTFQLMFYITIISVKCARNHIRELQMESKHPLLALLSEEKWHLEEQYEEFVERQGNEASRIQQKKAKAEKKAELEKKKKAQKKTKMNGKQTYVKPPQNVEEVTAQDEN